MIRNENGRYIRLEFSGRQCYFCDSTKASAFGTKYQKWACNRAEDGTVLHYLCHDCDARLWRIYHQELSRDYSRNNNKRRHKRVLRFKDKRVSLSYEIRKGYCSQCPNNIHNGSCRFTDMHHTLGYFIIFPWFGTVELCDPCHNTISVNERWSRK